MKKTLEFIFVCAIIGAVMYGLYYAFLNIEWGLGEIILVIGGAMLLYILNETNGCRGGECSGFFFIPPIFFLLLGALIILLR